MLVASFVRGVALSSFTRSFTLRGSVLKTTRIMSTETAQSVDSQEVKFFGQQSVQWWEKEKALLAMNNVRVPFCRKSVCADLGVTDLPAGLRIMDVGCGGGFLAEALTRIGFKVTGIDPTAEMVSVAKAHMSLDPTLEKNLTYVQSTIEDMAESVTSGKVPQFDAVITSEVVEHVANLPVFLHELAKTLKPGGTLVVTTINRTSKAYWFAIVLAEKVLRFIPAGTHQYEKLVQPEELKTILTREGLELIETQGTSYNPLTGNWSNCNSDEITYMAHYRKKI